MPTAIVDPFGNEIQACSISTMVKSKFDKKWFPSEAAWAKQVKADAFNVLRAKIKAGEVPVNTVVGRSPSGGKMVYKKIHDVPSVEISYKGDATKFYKPLEDFENDGLFKIDDWDFGPNMAKLAEQQKAIVDSAAKLKSYLSSEDMTVEIGDVVVDMTDNLGNVYKVKFNGYDGDMVPEYEIALPKGGGTLPLNHDGLSDALKNVGSNSGQFVKVEYKVGQVPPDMPIPHGLPVASTSKSIGALTNEDAATMFVKTKDELAKQYGLNIKAAGKLDDLVYKTIADQAGYTAAEMKAKIDAYKATGKKLSSLKKKVLPKTGDATQTATEKAVQKAAQAVKKEELKPEEVVQVWDDEAVAKAYIKAKDEIVAENTHGWTLYTKSDQFDSAILKRMQETLGPIKKETADTAIANYIATKQKLSVLKKQMIKKGELEPKADTLKGKKATEGAPKPPPQETGAGQVGKVTEDPKVVGPKQQLTDEQKSIIKDTWEGGNLPLSSSGEKIYNFAKIIAKQEGLGEDVLPILKWVDEYKAQKFGVANGNLYEKKVLEYLSDPAPKGWTPPSSSAFTTGHIAEAATYGELPADSTLFKEMGASEFDTLARTRMPRPTPEQVQQLRAYSGSYYYEINSALRGGSSLASHARGRVIQESMQPIPENIVARRGTSLHGLGLSDYSELPGAVGKTFVEPGFSSTAVGGSGQFSGQVNLVVQIPKGTRGAWLKPYSLYSHENELLLPAGTKFRIMKVEVKNEHYGKKTIVHVRVVS